MERIDKFAREGHFKDKDLPGTDTYDDGLNEKGEVVMPGSTSTESGGTYMEDAGPRDMRRRQNDYEQLEHEGLSIVEPDSGNTNSYDDEDDKAGDWLRARKAKQGEDDLREAA